MHIYKGILFTDNKDVYPVPYSPLQFSKGKYKIFLMNDSISMIATSTNLIDWKYKPVQLPYGTIQEINDKYYSAYYIDSPDHCNYCFAVSTDKKNFEVTFLKPENHGLDISFVYDTKFRIYARMNITPAVRNIGYMESEDFKNFTLMQEILSPDEQDKDNQFYSISVISTEKGYFGYLNVYNPITEITDVQLVFSENGIDSWKRLNDRKPILERKNNVKMLHACASVINEEVNIITISSDFYHDHRNREGNYYFTEHYTISLTKLYSYL